MCIARRIAKLLLCLGLSGTLLFMVLSLGACGSASGGASPTAVELQAFVKKAVVFAQQNGKEAALKAFMQPGEFLQGQFYIYATDFSGVCLAQGADPSQVGKNLMNMRDANGVEIVQQQIALAATGGGWLSYTFANPLDGNKPQSKLAYFLKVDDGWYVGSGTYGAEATRAPTKGEVKALVNKAYDYAKAHGKDAAIAEFMNPSSSFWLGQLYVFANDAQGIALCYPPNPSMVGENRWDVQDANGAYYVRDLINTAMKSDAGWVEYMYLDPVGNGLPQKKVSYVRKVDDTWYIGAGTYLPGG